MTDDFIVFRLTPTPTYTVSHRSSPNSYRIFCPCTRTLEKVFSPQQRATLVVSYCFSHSHFKVAQLLSQRLQNRFGRSSLSLSLSFLAHLSSLTFFKLHYMHRRYWEHGPRMVRLRFYFRC